MLSSLILNAVLVINAGDVPQAPPVPPKQVQAPTQAPAKHVQAPCPGGKCAVPTQAPDCRDGKCATSHGSERGPFMHRGPVRRVFHARPHLVGRLFGRGCRSGGCE
jgi:hypothetical protein